MKTLFILSLIALTSCSLLKNTQRLKSGNLEQKEFYGKIDFETKAGLPIVKINVNGIEANFLFDTGASSNVISVELAAKLNLEVVTTGYVNDAEGSSSVLEYVRIDSIAMDTINFLNTSAVVADLNSSVTASCFELDGIIGTNLMLKAFWKINYSEKFICFSHDLSKLKTSEGWSVLNFMTTRAGVPMIDLKLNDKRIENLIFDTGFSGGISISKGTIHTLSNDSALISTTFKTGTSSFGLYGLHKSDTTYYAKINKVDLGALELNNRIIAFGSHSNLMGSKFLSNYTVVLDWTSNHIYLKEIKKALYNSIETFGFNVLLVNNKLIIGSIFDDCEAREKLKNGDEILEINDENYQDLRKSNICDLYMSGSLSFGNLNHLKLRIKRGDKILIIRLLKHMVLK
jgi:hypothetical protein